MCITKRKKICWVTPDAFLDTDMDYKIMSGLLKHFDIYWFVVFGRNNRYKEADFKQLIDENPNLTVKFIYFTARGRYPSNCVNYYKLAKNVNAVMADLIYLNIGISTPWALAFFLKVSSRNTIITAHQGKVHEGMGHYKYYNFLRDIVYGRFHNVVMFSKSQAALFKERYPKSKIFQTYLGLKDFGKASINGNDSCNVNFLSFGSINYAKHIDLLIEAACNVYEKGYTNIRVKIAGKCNNWETFYKPLIKYPEIFETEIKMIANEEIPDLFVKADYFVQPYRVISQSGPFKIAMNYNTPLITSDLSGFSDEMVEGVTGFLFKRNDVDDLEKTLIKAMEVKSSIHDYHQLKSKMKAHVSSVYSAKSLIDKYCRIFNVIAR